MTDYSLFELFRVAGERMDHDWEFEQGAQAAYFDLARAARGLSNALGTWLTDEQDNALEALRASIAVEN